MKIKKDNANILLNKVNKRDATIVKKLLKELQKDEVYKIPIPIIWNAIFNFGLHIFKEALKQGDFKSVEQLKTWLKKQLKRG